MLNKLLVISGPTASGKSRFAEAVYSNISSVIINADALQVYNALPILTSKPLDFHDRVKYRLYGVFNAYSECSVAQWFTMIEKEIRDAWSKGMLPVVIGGTGFYIKSLLYGLSDVPPISDHAMFAVKQRFDSMGRESFFKKLCEDDPMVIKHLHTNDTYRVLRAAAVLEQTTRSIYSYFGNKELRYDGCLHLFFEPDRDHLYQWCNSRFDKMLKEGVVEEVREFVDGKGDNICAVEKAIGYKQIERYIRNEISLNEAIDETQQFTRNYAKRQYTWFRNQIKYRASVTYQNYSDIEQELLQSVMNYNSSGS